MKKGKVIGCILTLTVGMSLLAGCGKKVDGVDQAKMVDKYASYCELPNYKGLEYVQTKTEVTDEDVQSEIDSLLQSYSTKNKITEGKVENGDDVNIDFVGTVDGVEFEGGNSQGAGYDLVLGSGSMIPGFEEQIVGHSIGETFDIDVTFPEDYGKEELNGKAAVFAITINYKNDTQMPEYNDAFVASYTDAANVAEYEKSVRQNLAENNESSDKNANQSAVMELLVEATTFKEYPEQEMKKLIDRTVEQTEQAAQSYGYSLADYVTAAYGFADEESFRDYVSDLAEDFMKEKIVICAVAKDAGITVTEDEVQAYKQKIMDGYGYKDEKELEEQYSSEDIIYYSLADKVISHVLELGVPVEATETDATQTDVE